jgi:hypothetical protein
MTTDFERLLELGCTDLPECRCGKEMHFGVETNNAVAAN